MYRRHMDIAQLSKIDRSSKSKAARMLAPSIAANPAPPTSELVAHHVQRKTMSQAEI